MLLELNTVSSAEVTIRRAKREDGAALQDFIGRTYGIGAPFKGPDRWDWQFCSNPAHPHDDDEPSMWLAFSNDRVVGQTGVQDSAIWVDGEPHPAGWIVDVMVDAEFRGQGIGHRIHEKIMAERSCLVTLTMAAATRRIAEKAGAITLGPTREFVYPHRLTGRTLARFLNYKAQYGKNRQLAIGPFNASRVGPAIGSGVARTAARLRTKPVSLDGYEIEEIDRFTRRHGDFLQRWRSDQSAVFERTAETLNWRYVDVPELIYLRYGLLQNDELVGILVARICEPPELPAGVVVEALARRGDVVTHTALIELAKRTMGQRCEYLEAASGTPEMMGVLRQAGFIATRTMCPTIVCSDSKLRAKLREHLDDWFFNRGDHDWDQIHPV